MIDEIRDAYETTQSAWEAVVRVTIGDSVPDAEQLEKARRLLREARDELGDWLDMHGGEA